MNIIFYKPNIVYYFFDLCETVCIALYQYMIYYLFIISECFIWTLYVLYCLVDRYLILLILLFEQILSYPTIIFVVIGLGISLYYTKCFLEIILRYHDHETVS